MSDPKWTHKAIVVAALLAFGAVIAAVAEATGWPVDPIVAVITASAGVLAVIWGK